MSRSGYHEIDDPRDLVMYRGHVASAIRGKRGQRLLDDLAMALDAMPKKELFTGYLEGDPGEYCALGVVGAKRGIDLDLLEADEEEDGGNNAKIAAAFDIAVQLAAEIEYVNDEAGGWSPSPEARARGMRETPAERWTRVRKWVSENIKAAP